MEKEIRDNLIRCQLDILDQIDLICKKHDIKYFLMWGTLIGAVRHKGYIPWDDDIDISMMRDDYNKFLKIAKKELPNKYFLQTGLTDKNHHLFFSKIRLNNTAFCEKRERNQKHHRGIFVDIIPLDYRKDKLSFIRKFKDKLYDRTNKYVYLKREGLKLGKLKFFNLLPESWVVRLRDKFASGKGDNCTSFRFTFKCYDFFPTSTLVFQGKEYPVPRNYDKVLTEVYGEYMKLPPEDQRVTHEPLFISFDLEKDKEKYKEFLENKNA